MKIQVKGWIGKDGKAVNFDILIPVSIVSESKMIKFARFVDFIQFRKQATHLHYENCNGDTIMFNNADIMKEFNLSQSESFEMEDNYYKMRKFVMQRVAKSMNMPTNSKEVRYCYSGEVVATMFE